MARTWLSVRVELLGGRGEDLWPYPGRDLLVGPSHTFADLAEAIDTALARWDRGHLCQFTLADGTVVTDEETGLDAAGAPFGPLAPSSLVLERTKVSDRVAPGDAFRYLFDFGDDWTHACTVDDAKVDPVEVGGITPRKPIPVWGWGSIPDQYGRRWREDGDPEQRAPRRPRAPHPMLAFGWPDVAASPVDVRELRGATYRGDVPAILAAIEGREIDDALQQVGLGLQVVLARDLERGGSLVASVLNRLDLRGAPGDDVLRDDLLAQVRGTPVAARQLAVDLSELADALHVDRMEPGGLLDLRTGDIIPGALLDPVHVSEDDLPDLETEPDRWHELDRLDSRIQWADMAEFASRQTNTAVRDRLTSAIEGKGAFRRFRDAVDAEDVVEQWRRFSDDRRIGRARAYLADIGIRATPTR